MCDLSNAYVRNEHEETSTRLSGSFGVAASEVAERFAFFGIEMNMVVYLVTQMHQSLPNAATHTADWIGTAYFLTLFGAFIADAYLGRFLTVITFSCIYSMGMVMLTLLGSLDSLRPPVCTKPPCTQASSSQTAFLYSALALIALGTGGIKPCFSSFGRDQFDEFDKKEAERNARFLTVFLCD